MEHIIKNKQEDLSEEERDILFNAYKNKISSYRNTFQIIKAYESKESKKNDSPYLKYIKEYKLKIKKEFQILCDNVINNIDKFILPKSFDKDNKIYYYKKKADYCKYIIENFDDTGETEMYLDMYITSYNNSIELLKNSNHKDSVKLGLLLGLSTFYYDVIGNKMYAYKLASDTLNKSKKELEGADENDPKIQNALSMKNLIEETVARWKNENNF